MAYKKKYTREYLKTLNKQELIEIVIKCNSGGAKKREPQNLSIKELADKLLNNFTYDLNSCKIWTGAYADKYPYYFYNGKKRSVRNIIAEAYGIKPGKLRMKCGNISCIASNHLKPA